ncbi:MAG: GIY-YIG nuclease family protein [bacterium]
MSYFVYMLLCEGGSYYLGTTNNVPKRFLTHQSGKGASYTRSHKPVKVVYQEELPDKSGALKREATLKKLSHQQKIILISSSHELPFRSQ